LNLQGWTSKKGSVELAIILLTNLRVTARNIIQYFLSYSLLYPFL
jgi:hypothetical protein